MSGDIYYPIVEPPDNLALTWSPARFEGSCMFCPHDHLHPNVLVVQSKNLPGDISVRICRKCLDEIERKVGRR